MKSGTLCSRKDGRPVRVTLRHDFTRRGLVKLIRIVQGDNRPELRLAKRTSSVRWRQTVDIDWGRAPEGVDAIQD